MECWKNDSRRWRSDRWALDASTRIIWCTWRWFCSQGLRQVSGGVSARRGHASHLLRLRVPEVPGQLRREPGKQSLDQAAPSPTCDHFRRQLVMGLIARLFSRWAQWSPVARTWWTWKPCWRCTIWTMPLRGSRHSDCFSAFTLSIVSDFSTFSLVHVSFVFCLTYLYVLWIFLQLLLYANYIMIFVSEIKRTSKYTY